MYSELLNVAIKAALFSGSILFDHHQACVNSSHGKDIKLEADVESENRVFEILKQTEINILSEEAGYIEHNKNSDLFWIVDPLDGSLNYSRNIPLNCISIALWKKNEPIFGIIYDYNHNSIYRGVVGEGAYLNDKEIVVSDIVEKSKAIITTGFPVYTSFDDESLINFIKTIQDYKKVRLLGSAALSLSFVAAGYVEAYAENNIAIWDVAAGIALVLAAGGKVNFSFSTRNRNLLNVFASNGKFDI
jgi:myo-inositol-1(or 4)-monophosphatase